MKLAAIIRREYLERVRSKGFVISTLLIPFLMSLTIVIPMLTDERVEDHHAVAVLDPEGGWYEALDAVVATYYDGKVDLVPVRLNGRGVDAGVADIQDMIRQEAVDGGLVFGENFREEPTLRYYVKSVSAGLASETLRPAVSRVLRQARFEARGVDEELGAYLLERPAWERLTVSEQGDAVVRDERAVLSMGFTMIMILYMMVLMYGQQTLTGVIDEKTSRVVEVILSSVPSWQLMLGKIVGIGAAGLTQILIWTASLYAASLRGIQVAGFSIDTSVLPPVVLVSFLVLFVLGFLLFSAIYAGVGALCNTIQEAQPFATPVMMFIILPMLMMTLVMKQPDSPLAVILSLIPVFTPILMFMRVIMDTPPLWQIGLSWVLMAVTIVFLARTAGKLFRVGMLMHGAAPSWGTLVKTLRAPD